MMQKNEGNRLARWLAHYSKLFGMKNLFIFDNGSDDPYTLVLLREAEYAGAKIDRSLTDPKDWQAKGGHFTDIIASMDENEDYDFALPVDCDEILCVFTKTGLSLDKRDILLEFERLRPFRCAFSLNLSLFNLPPNPDRLEQHIGWYAPNRHFPKGFVPARCQARIDDGHHFPLSEEQPDQIPTCLTYLHHHHRPWQEMLDLSRQKLALEVDINDPDMLIEHARHARPGGHLVGFLHDTPESYAARYQNEVHIFFEGGSVLLNTPKGLKFWNAAHYLAHHPDVTGYIPGPLNHYLMYGFSEGRDPG